MVICAGPTGHLVFSPYLKAGTTTRRKCSNTTTTRECKTTMNTKRENLFLTHARLHLHLSACRIMESLNTRTHSHSPPYSLPLLMLLVPRPLLVHPRAGVCITCSRNRDVMNAHRSTTTTTITIITEYRVHPSATYDI